MRTKLSGSVIASFPLPMANFLLTAKLRQSMPQSPDPFNAAAQRRTLPPFWNPLLRRNPDIPDGLWMRIGSILIDPPLNLGAEMPDEALHGPSRRISQSANGMALDLGRDLQQHIDFALMGAPLGHAGEYAPEPACAFAAGRALAAALMLIKIADTGDCAHNVCRLIDHNNGGSAECRPELLQRIEIHLRIEDLLRRDKRHGRAAGNHRKKIIEPATHAAAVTLDQLAEGDRHRLFHIAGLVDMAGDAEELGAGIVLGAKA